MLATLLDGITVFLLLVGTIFMVIASIGLLRMPDVFVRMSATSKAATLAVVCMLLAVAIYFRTVGIVSRALATAIFLYITAPVATHMIGRAAYIDPDIHPSEYTVIDDLKDCYHPADE